MRNVANTVMTRPGSPGELEDTITMLLDNNTCMYEVVGV